MGIDRVACLKGYDDDDEEERGNSIGDSIKTLNDKTEELRWQREELF